MFQVREISVIHEREENNGMVFLLCVFKKPLLMSLYEYKTLKKEIQK